MLRSIVTVLFVAFYLILSTPLMLYVTVLRCFNKEKADRISLHNVCWAFGWVNRLAGMKIEKEGIKNIPKDTACLFVANHQSILDVTVTYPMMIDRTGFIAKDNLKKVPLLNIWMSKLYCFFLDRKSKRAGLDMILYSIEKIKEGISIFIFPEGTRNRDNLNEVAEFKSGAVKMASKTGCPIVPVAIKGTRPVLEDHFPFLKKGNVKVKFGEPIIIDELDEENKKHLADYCHEKVQRLLDTM